MDFISAKHYEDFEALIFEYYHNCDELRQNKLLEEFSLISDERNEIISITNETNSHTKPLRIGFVGGFSTGKSSIINSLVGEELLGVKLKPATAKITELIYGQKFEILEAAEEEPGQFIYTEISLEDYKKRSIDRNNIQTISHYVIKHPSKNLSRFTIVDTPGFSSTSKEDDVLTKKWIKSLDLLIWIFDINKVGDKVEFDLIKNINSATTILGIINKADQKPPSAREKIREEITKTGLIEDVFFYSANKTFEFHKVVEANSVTTKSINNQIEKLIREGHDFIIEKNNNEILLNFDNSQKCFVCKQPKENEFIEYYDLLLSKIDDVRNNDITNILNKSLVSKRFKFNSSVYDLLISIKEDLIRTLNDQNKKLKIFEKDKKSLKTSDERLWSRVQEKRKVNFDVFYKEFFKRLTDYLIYKKKDEGLFSTDIYICIRHVADEEVQEELESYISKEFKQYLKSSLAIYKNEIQPTIFYQFSSIDDIILNADSNIPDEINGLIASSLDSILGYYRNFEAYKTDDFYKSKEFHMHNLDLVIPDELLDDLLLNMMAKDSSKSYYRAVDSLNYKIEESSRIIAETSEQLERVNKLLDLKK